jgi:hypothetical protein
MNLSARLSAPAFFADFQNGGTLPRFGGRA